MFTGIVEKTGKLIAKNNIDSNTVFTIACDFVNELKIDQSISHNGACLTVTNIHENSYEVVLVSETLERTCFKEIEIGDTINLERCLKLGDRLDGHWVTGHVDQVGEVVQIIDEKGSWKVILRYDYKLYENVTVPKGSICVNGVSLTVVDSWVDSFSVVLIPYTWEQTNMNQLKTGQKVNLEFDILGKYIKKFSKI